MPEHRVPEEVEHWPVSSQATLNSVAIVTQPNKKEKRSLSLTLRWLGRLPGERLLIVYTYRASPALNFDLVGRFILACQKPLEAEIIIILVTR